MNENQFKEKIEYIVEALKERGYDPYMQLLGFITEREPTYITLKQLDGKLQMTVRKVENIATAVEVLKSL